MCTLGSTTTIAFLSVRSPTPNAARFLVCCAACVRWFAFDELLELRLNYLVSWSLHTWVCGVTLSEGEAFIYSPDACTARQTSPVRHGLMEDFPALKSKGSLAVERIDML